MFKALSAVTAAAGLLLAFSSPMAAQSITSGDVTGIVTDPSSAAVPGADVTLTNTGTNAAQKTITGSDGSYRFSFVAPGTYKVSISAKGFLTSERGGVAVRTGQPTGVNVQLQLATATQTVEVSSATTVVQTENADVATTFDTELMQNLPNPGGDLTYIAQTAPGVVMNTQSGYGNFEADGMPGTSNLFTINGVNYNDPFQGVNNSGASNLSLGSNDIAEANVVTSPYSAQYGQYAGSQITYSTKSGTNDFHGDAIYMWNGRALNANQFFSNEVGQGTPFNNFNQWSAGVQGPIWKNHTFFDVNYEGVHNVLPTASALTRIPSPQFQAATLANLATNGHADEIPFYKQAFAVYNNAAGAASAVPVANGCQGFSGPDIGTCTLQFRTTPPNKNTEYQWSARVDQVFGENDRGYIRVLRDNGFQPTFTSPFGPVFNAQSNQPQMNGQISETHTFGPRTVNEFKGSALFYSAAFAPSDPNGALAAMPTFLDFTGNAITGTGAWGQPGPAFFPQGRRVFQYQVLDDLSTIRGKHTFRIGFSWLHDTVTALDFQGVAGAIHGQVTTNLTDFFNGGGPGTTLNQAFPSSTEQGLRFNTIGGYLSDDWKVSSNLSLSLNLRFEHYANPTCDSNCFSLLANQFTGAVDPKAASTPYNQLILAGQKHAFPDTHAVVVEPRVGIAWRPFHNDRTVIRTGAGIFADELPGGLAENSAFNSPGLAVFNVGGGALAPGLPNGLFATAAQANQTLLTQFQSGGSFNSISQSVPGFTPPSFSAFPSNFPQPTYYKWNFQVEQAIGAKMVFTANYSGNHGIHIPVSDQALNAFCPPDVCPSGFTGLPAAAPNPAFGQVTQYLSAGTSNYNGLSLSLQRRLSAALNFNINYTWSHALDVVSNGGVSNEPFGFLATNRSVSTPQDPFNIKRNYGNADYDVRHYLSSSIVFTDMFRHAGMHWGPNRIFSGWTLSGNWFWRSGLPFTVVDSGALPALSNLNYSGVIFTSPVAKVQHTCTDAVNTPCLSAGQFAPAAQISSTKVLSTTGFGTIGRNSIYGPHFFNIDLGLMKDIAITERVRFSFGANAFNLLNHPNFDQPVNDIASPDFGRSIAAVGTPTSLLGAFVGAGSSPRFVELKGVVRF